MRMKPIVVVVAGIILTLQWPFMKLERAEVKLAEFYSEMASGDFGAALDSINQAIRLWPSNAHYYDWRAYCRSQNLPSHCSRKSRNTNSNSVNPNPEFITAAIQDYQYALVLNSRDAVAHHNLAWLEHLLGEDFGAERDLKASIEIDPNNAIFHLSYGMFLDENGQENMSQGQYEAAIELTPSILDSPFFSEYRNRKPEVSDSIVAKCISRLELQLKNNDDPILEARLGKLYLFSGQIERSRQLLERAVAQLPNLPLVWFNLGEVNIAQNDLVHAFVCYQRANAIDASLARPYLLMGEVSIRHFEKSSAVRYLRLAIERWQRVNPITAAHNNRLYAGPRQTIDDLLPTTLVWYTTPCEASRAWRDLSQLFPQREEYARRSQTCEQLPSPHEWVFPMRP